MDKANVLSRRIIVIVALFFIALQGFPGLANTETDRSVPRTGRIESAWSQNGYNIQSENETRFVVLTFEYQNLVSLIPPQNKMIVFSKIGKMVKNGPEKIYRENIEKVMSKSGFEEAYIEDTLNIVESDDFNWSTEYRVHEDRFNISPYKNTNLVFELIFTPDQGNEQNTAAPGKDDKIGELKKRIEVLENRNKALLDELSGSLEDNKARDRRINRLLDEIETLEANLEKYRSLAKFRAGIVDNQKTIIDRYKQIVETNKQALEDKKTEIASINMKHVTELEEKQEAIDQQTREIKNLKDELKSAKNEMALMDHEIQTLNNRIGELKEMFSKRKNYLLSQINTLESRLFQVGKANAEETKTKEATTVTAEKEVSNTKNERSEIEKKEEKTVAESPGNEADAEEKNKVKADAVKSDEPEDPVENKKKLKRIVAMREDRKLYTIVYQYNSEGHPVEEKVMLPNANTAEKTVSLYDEEGKLKEQKIFREGSLVTKNHFKHDETGRLIRILTYSAEGEITGYQLLEYNPEASEEEPASIKRYEETKLKTLTENVFDSKGRIVETRTYNSSGELLARSAITFEDDSPKKTTYYENGEIAAYTIVDYDENSRPVSQKNYNQNGTLINTLLFEYH